MTSAASHPVEELRARLLELLDSCPVEQCNPEDCPLCEVRKLGRNERLRWFSALSESDLRYLAAYHYVCMQVKLGNQSKTSASQVRTGKRSRAKATIR